MHCPLWPLGSAHCLTSARLQHKEISWFDKTVHGRHDSHCSLSFFRSTSTRRATMSDLTYPLFPFFAFLGFFLSLIPLPWHLQAWNSGTCYYMMWAALSCLNQFVNSVVWHNNARNISPAWCEVCKCNTVVPYNLAKLTCLFKAIRILMGATVGLPLSSLCINRRLYHIASSQTPAMGRSAVGLPSLDRHQFIN